MFGRGRMSGYGYGPAGECICPKCGYVVAHTAGSPCYTMRCPRRGIQMTRAH